MLKGELGCPFVANASKVIGCVSTGSSLFQLFLKTLKDTTSPETLLLRTRK